MKPPKRILLVRPSALGDVCRTVPLAASLKRHWPEAEIDWVVNAPFADAVRGHPAVRRTIRFDRKSIGRSLARGNPTPLRRFIAKLRSRQYDIAIDAQGLARSAAVTRLSGAPIRVGHADARELGWTVLTHRVTSPADAHTVDRMLDLLGPLGVPPRDDMTLSPPADSRYDAAIDPNAIVLAPTSIWPGKQWPIARFHELAARLHAKDVGPFVVVGGPGERDQCEPLLSDGSLPVVDFVGKTSVGQLMDIIRRCRLVVANDSAALHMAVGFDKPVVALFGPTDTRRVGPYRRSDDVLQHTSETSTATHKDESAGRAMMERISVDEVEAAVLDRL
ncbi:MAG: glycosyltransferase family 9 protein [Planctomycetota bacterium]